MNPEQLPSLEEQRDIAVGNIALAAYRIVAKRYGPDGHTPRAYHNLQHFTDVVYDAIAISFAAMEAGHITRRQKDCCTLSAVGHDIEQGLGSHNESASVEWIWGEMSRYRCFERDDFADVEEAILGTAVTIGADKTVTQHTNPNHYVAMLTADADLAALGKVFDTYWNRATALHREFHPDIALEGSRLQEFIDWQLVVQRNHRFWTPEAQEAFPHKTVNIARLEHMRQEAS